MQWQVVTAHLLAVLHSVVGRPVGRLRLADCHLSAPVQSSPQHSALHTICFSHCLLNTTSTVAASTCLVRSSYSSRQISITRRLGLYCELVVLCS